MYVTILTPVVTYASGTWILTEKDAMQLCIFKDKSYERYLVQCKLEKLHGE
jgi:hypothetical protein